MKRKIFLISSMVMAIILIGAGLAWADYPPSNTIKWEQKPDPNGFNVQASNFRTLADDFQYTQSGYITDVHIWGSFLNDTGPDPKMLFFIGFFANDPGPPSSSLVELKRFIFGPGTYTVQHWDTYPNEKFLDPWQGIIGSTKRCIYLILIWKAREVFISNRARSTG